MNEITLPVQTYRKLLQVAERRQLDVPTLIEAYLAQDTDDVPDWTEPDPVVVREQQAFLRTHPHLVEQYLNEYIAMCNEQVIDHDFDLGSLCRRVRPRYPDQFVWIAKVELEPLPPLHIRSPRLIRS